MSEEMPADNALQPGSAKGLTHIHHLDFVPFFPTRTQQAGPHVGSSTLPDD
jgi:hypothetical protein